MEASWDKAIQGGENFGGAGWCWPLSRQDWGSGGATWVGTVVLEKPSAPQELSTKESMHTAGACYKSTLELLLPKREFPWFLSQPTPVPLPGKSHGWRSWWATVHGVTKSRTRLSNFTHWLTLSLCWNYAVSARRITLDTVNICEEVAFS